MKELRMTIQGHPVVLKNSKQICFNRKTGRRFVKSNGRVDDWMKDAVAQVWQQTAGMARPYFRGPVRVAMKICGAWKADSQSIPDLSNLYQSIEDILEDAGVLGDDNQIESHDGSRRVRLCPACGRRPILKAGPRKGQPADDCGQVKRCPFERIEVTIIPFVNVEL